MPLSDAGELFAVDCETKGVDPTAPDTRVVGLGISNEDRVLYVDFEQLSEECHKWIKDWLRSVRLVAFNTYFDGGFLQQYTGQWLDWIGCSYGLFKFLSTEGHKGQSWSLETAQLDYLGWPYTNKSEMDFALKQAGLGKADMWKLDPETLGTYCASDADAAWQLWVALTQECQRPELEFVLPFHQREFMTSVKLLVEAQFGGIYIDQERLRTCHADLLQRIDTALDAFLNHPQAAPHISAYNAAVLESWQRAEPPRFTKKGEEAVRYTNWLAKKDTVLETSGFNPNSKAQLRTLFYEKLKFKVTRKTDSGLPAVDKKILPKLGEPGKLLNKYNLLVKLRGYVERVIDKSARDSHVHPQFNSFGTYTGRLSGSGGLNVQQLSKDAPFLYAWRAPDGYKMVQADLTSLEPVILTEFSKDRTLLSIYGPNAPEQDIYLYFSAQIPGLCEGIVKYYDPHNPTPAGIAAAKKHHKHERGIAKRIWLMMSYGAGVNKIHSELALDGIALKRAEVANIVAGIKKLVSGTFDFGDQLRTMWQHSGGWVPSVVGTPICCSHQYTHDLLNRFCQTSGHQFLQRWLYYTDLLRNERGVDMRPLIPDLHDEMIWLAPENQAEAAAQITQDALAMANEETAMDIFVKGPPMIADNLAQIKTEDYEEFLASQYA